jgi:hypothetical protein
MMQMGDELIQTIDDWETYGIEASKWRDEEPIQIARKYQIKELFWVNNNLSETCKLETEFGAH